MSSLLKRVLHLSIFYAIGPSRDEGSPRSGLRWSPTLCHPLLIQAFVTSLFTSFFTIPDKPLSLNSMWTSSLQKLTIPQHSNNPYLKGALKQGLCTCSTFKPFNLMYCSTTFIEIYNHSSGLFGTSLGTF